MSCAGRFPGAKERTFCKTCKHFPNFLTKNNIFGSERQITLEVIENKFSNGCSERIILIIKLVVNGGVLFVIFVKINLVVK